MRVVYPDAGVHIYELKCTFAILFHTLMATAETGAVYCSVVKSDLCLGKLYTRVPEMEILFGHRTH